MLRFMGKKLKKWQDYGWIIALLVIAYIAYRVIPAIDPRSGIDGWGDLFAALILGVKGVMVTIGAWLSKNLYWWEPIDEDEERWHAAIEADAERTGANYSFSGAAGHVATPTNNPHLASARAALILVVKDRIEWIVWLVFWGWVLFCN